MSGAISIAISAGRGSSEGSPRRDVTSENLDGCYSWESAVLGLGKVGEG